MDVRPLSSSDVDDLLDIRHRSFGPMPSGDQDDWRAMVAKGVAAGEYLGVYDSGQLVASARYHRFRQWWHGREIPMAGIASVVVSPDVRGRGVGRLLMAATLDLVAAQGFPLSALYPTTMPVYRSLGWEFAGCRHFVTVPTDALRALGRGPGGRQGSAELVKLRRVGAEDTAEMWRLTVLQADTGPLWPHRPTIGHRCAFDSGPATMRYGFERGGLPVG